MEFREGIFVFWFFNSFRRFRIFFCRFRIFLFFFFILVSNILCFWVWFWLLLSCIWSFLFFFLVLNFLVLYCFNFFFCCVSFFIKSLLLFLSFEIVFLVRIICRFKFCVNSNSVLYCVCRFCLGLLGGFVVLNIFEFGRFFEIRCILIFRIEVCKIVFLLICFCRRFFILLYVVCSVWSESFFSWFVKLSWRLLKWFFFVMVFVLVFFLLLLMIFMFFFIF